MTQIKTKIPAELEPAAVGGMVTDSKYVKDRVKNKTQEEVNADTEGRVSTLEESVGTGGSVDERIATAKSEVIGDAGTDYDTLGKLENKLQEEVANRASQNYTKAETYNKTELNNMITTPNQEYETYTATDQTTDVTDVLPATGEANTVYRVGNWDGTQYDTTCYTEYAWNGSAYIKLNTKEYGIDDEPTVGSHNLVESGGVYEAIEDVKEYLPYDETIVDNPDIVSGKIVKQNGTVEDNQSFGYTNLIELPIGSTIHTTTYVSLSALNAGIYKTDSSGNFISTLYGTPGVSAVSVEYANDTDSTIYIGLCSYPAFLKYRITSIMEAGSKELQNKMESDIYPAENVLNITSGSSHGYGEDKLNINIPQGVKFKVSIEDGTGRWGGANTDIKLIYSDSSSKSNLISGGKPLISVAEKDIVQIQVYIGSNNVLLSGTLLMTVQKELSYVVERVENIEKKTGVLPQWKGKTIGLYGDSITQLCGNDSVTPHSWADYIQQAIECNFVPRGWGSTFTCHNYVPNVQKGQTPAGVSVWWEFDYNGNRKDVGQGDVVTSYTGMCDWQRIITQFPATIKDTIDAVILMGGTNDLGTKPIGDTTFIEGSLTDPDTQDVPWGQSAYFNGGDYDINTFKGAVCSAIMKLQAWMPQAVIIIATPLSAPNKNPGATNANTNVPFVVPSGDQQGLTIEDYADAAMKSAMYLSTPVIDIFGNTGINHFNRSHHLVDAVHPSSQDGNGITDAGGVMHYDGCKNMARVFLGGLTVIHPKIDYAEWTES